MEQLAVLSRRIRALKGVAASMHEGAIHTEVIPEIDKVLALPDELEGRSVGELEAVARQLREYEQTFDRMGYALLEQLMPTTGVSLIFRIVRARDAFRAGLRAMIGRTLALADGTQLAIDQQTVDALSRHSLSIGTPPVTDGTRLLVSRALFGRDVARLADFTEILDCDRVDLERLFELLQQLVETSMHYCSAAEEAAFLHEAAEFSNFEGGRLFNRVVITESPRRVIELIRRHVFDKLGPEREPPVRIVAEVDRLDASLIAEMQAAPNHVFVVRITRIPHRLIQRQGVDSPWLDVLGRLVLVEDTPRARRSNATIVYTLFPHLARTLRNIQTSFGGRPANTQLVLRRVLEQFSPEALGRIEEALGARLATLEADGALDASVDQIRTQEWTRDNLFDHLALAKLRRCVGFLRAMATPGEAPPEQLVELRDRVAASWMRYFYKGLPTEEYRALVVPGGGRGALTLVGEYHRQRTREEVKHFRERSLRACRERLEEIKSTLEIPPSSTDEIEAAIRQSQLQALSPTQWKVSDDNASLTEHLMRSMVYRAAEAAGKLASRTRASLDRAAFGNVTGGAAALLKRTMSSGGFGALHGRLEDVVGKRVGAYDRRLRDVLAPVHEAVRETQRSLADLKGELDPIAVSEIEAILNLIEQQHFYPTLIVCQLSWSYDNVFPEKDFPASCAIRIPLNARHEMDPEALLRRLEELRYLLRRFPEIFELFCRTMLLVINSPHNPTAVVYRRETVLRLMQIATEYGITMVDDNSYHKLLTKEQKDRERDLCAAQIYEEHRGLFTRPLRLITVGATTKGLQGAGDRTGIVHSTIAEAIQFIGDRCSDPHYLSLYTTLLKLENGISAKHHTTRVEELAGALLDPTATSAHERLKELLAEELSRARDERFPVAVFETLLEGYERLLRLSQRGATVRHLSAAASELMKELKHLRVERSLRTDVQKRIEQARMALLRAGAAKDAGDQPLRFIEPRGAFYCCFALCDPRDVRGIREFLQAIAAARGVDVTYAGDGYVRISLGGEIAGDKRSYDHLGLVIELYTRILRHYWQRFEARQRDVEALAEIFDTPMVSVAPEDAAPAAESPANGVRQLAAALVDLQPLLAAHPRVASEGQLALPVEPSERGMVYCIEEGRSVTDKIFVHKEVVCESVDEMLASRSFRVLYRRLLRKVYRQVLPDPSLTFVQVENQFGPLACLAAYRDRQLIDDQFREVVRALYRAWNGPTVAKVLVARLAAESHQEKTSALHGINHTLSELIDELMHAFAVPAKEIGGHSAFDVGFEALAEIEPNAAMPAYLQRVIRDCPFAGATAALDPAPSYKTGAVKRIGDNRYGFIRRGGDEALGQSAGEVPTRAAPSLAYFQQRMDQLAHCGHLGDYVAKPVQVGPFPMLLLVHRSFFHQINDELRLFPQIEAVQQRERLHRLRWEGVLLFGVPAKLFGDSYKSGYVIDRCADGSPLPTAWVAREDATDYIGFLKKSLLTLHNERVKAMGGMPVHGSMITITFKNGLRKTLVLSADSGAGKSETITAMMEEMASGGKLSAMLERIDILAGDMLSLWRGEDGQIYAFGTETGDFMRLTDIGETWKRQFGDLLKRASFTNLDFPKNPRATIPGICDQRKVLTPTRVNGFFYINNYETPGASSVALIEDPHQALKQVLVRGRRKNKGTSGDQPSLRAGLEFAGETALVVRFRHALDRLLAWQQVKLDGRTATCLVYRDGAEDVYLAREVVNAAFKGRTFKDKKGETLRIASIEHGVMQNVFWLGLGGGRRVPLDREVYDQIYEPLVSTFCGNPFVDPAGMDRTLGTFAEAMHTARVHTGEIKTQLARSGFEFNGPGKAAEDVVEFLLEDEEVNARFQRNKHKVSQGMQIFGDVIRAGANLPVELEAYNLLRLEEQESAHVQFVDLDDGRFTIPTPFYRYQPRGDAAAAFCPAIALPEHVETIEDICSNPDYDLPVERLDVDLRAYDVIRFWNHVAELTYQVLLVNGVLSLGSSETELARYPLEVRKARIIAERIIGTRGPAGLSRDADAA